MLDSQQNTIEQAANQEVCSFLLTELVANIFHPRLALRVTSLDNVEANFENNFKIERSLQLLSKDIFNRI